LDRGYIQFNTAQYISQEEEATRLLAHTFPSDTESENEEDMSTTTAGKKTGVETNIRSTANEINYHKSSDGLEGNGGNGSIKMRADANSFSGEEVDGEALEQAIEAIEGKKKKWYAYLTTREFWLVLFIGYCFLSLPFSGSE